MFSYILMFLGGLTIGLLLMIYDKPEAKGSLVVYEEEPDKFAMYLNITQKDLELIKKANYILFRIDRSRTQESQD